MRPIEETVRENTRALLDEVDRTGVLPREAAVAMAKRRVLRAMRLRRFGRRPEPVEAPFDGPQAAG